MVFIAVGTPSRRGDGEADMSYVYAAAREIAAAASGYTVIVDEIDGACWHGRHHRADRRAGEPGRRHFGRVQSGISAGGHRDRRFPSARPGCQSAPTTPERARSWRGASAAANATDPDRGDAPAHGGTHQVCRERVPGDEDHLHQRNGGPLRAGRSSGAGCGARHRPRSPHRHAVLERRTGLWGVVLSEGHAGAAAHGAGSWRGIRLVEQTVAVNDARKRRMARK